MGNSYEVFVLVDSVDYEGESILGVYSTMENAKKAADLWEISQFCFDKLIARFKCDYSVYTARLFFLTIRQLPSAKKW